MISTVVHQSMLSGPRTWGTQDLQAKCQTGNVVGLVPIEYHYGVWIMRAHRRSRECHGVGDAMRGLSRRAFRFGRRAHQSECRGSLQAAGPAAVGSAAAAKMGSRFRVGVGRFRVGVGRFRVPREARKRRSAAAGVSDGGRLFSQYYIDLQAAAWDTWCSWLLGRMSRCRLSGTETITCAPVC